MKDERLRLTDSELSARAGAVLAKNTHGRIVRASPGLYPHQWSWDAAFIAIGVAARDPERAAGQLDALFEGQWRNGMVPSIVFDPASEGYFPGPDRWECMRVAKMAPGIDTSGICQPPVHAIAAEEIHSSFVRHGLRDRGDAWRDSVIPKLASWHDFLIRERRDERTGLMTIFHGWESGMDNSPRFDAPYSRVRVDPQLPAFVRKDIRIADPRDRPRNADYDRYLTLLEEAKRAGYDSQAIRQSGHFQVGDVVFTALFARAARSLSALAASAGSRRGSQGDGEEEARAAVLRTVDPVSLCAYDVDLLTGEPLEPKTLAQFAPLVMGGAPESVAGAELALLFGSSWCGFPGFSLPLPPSTSPVDPAFDQSRYWRGPVWPVMNWLFSYALRKDGHGEEAAILRDAGLDQIRDGSCAEYYDPFSGTPLGSRDQSWTAAVALDWLEGSGSPAV